MTGMKWVPMPASSKSVRMTARSKTEQVAIRVQSRPLPKLLACFSSTTYFSFSLLGEGHFRQQKPNVKNPGSSFHLLLFRRRPPSRPLYPLLRGSYFPTLLFGPIADGWWQIHRLLSCDPLCMFMARFFLILIQTIFFFCFDQTLQSFFFLLEFFREKIEEENFLLV